jgi:hypothetical protein
MKNHRAVLPFALAVFSALPLLTRPALADEPSFTFRYKEPVGNDTLYGELRCTGERRDGDRIFYQKCNPRAKDFEPIVLSLGLVASHDKLQSLGINEQKRARRLAALHAANRHLKRRREKFYANESKAAEYKRLGGAKECVKREIAKAVEECRSNDSSDMNCEAQFPDED